MSEWLHDLPLKDIVFKAIMVMPSLLLQNPSQKSKSKDIWELWNEDWNCGSQEKYGTVKESDTIQKSI